MVHRRYGYRGVVVAVDATCAAPDAWYLSNRTRPPREQAWYHVLVHAADHATYAAESNLDSDPDPEPIAHPMLARYFSGFDGQRHLRNDAKWPGW